MFTKPITIPPIAASDLSNDMSSIRRLLLAAAISPHFCTSLLENPSSTVRKGFGGERFHLSELTLNLIGSVQASSLPEFIQQLNQSFSDHLLHQEYAQAAL
ncbi:MAG: hypothetical protein HY863_02305 [Chloroflexi bacterium]|nr:hypothetical protein [Chloroflexota bacterium]